MLDLYGPFSFDVTPMHPTHFPYDPNRRPDVLDIALLKNVNLHWLYFVELHDELNSDHRPVIMEFAPRSGSTDPSQTSLSPSDH